MNHNGIADASFKLNLPCVNWLNSFMKRLNLSKQIADNVTSAKAEITLAVINEYFDHLTNSLEGISPENCFNYNKINVEDNPGAKKLVPPCALKQVERKAKHSKQSVSIMFCRNASGNYLSPMMGV